MSLKQPKLTLSFFSTVSAITFIFIRFNITTEVYYENFNKIACEAQDRQEFNLQRVMLAAFSHRTGGAELQDIDFMTISITLSTVHRRILNMAILHFKTCFRAVNGNYICIPSECFNPLCSFYTSSSFDIQLTAKEETKLNLITTVRSQPTLRQN